MTKDAALAAAQRAANREGVPYLAIKARNGQWMREREAFVLSAPGRIIYPPECERVRCEPCKVV